MQSPPAFLQRGAQYDSIQKFNNKWVVLLGLMTGRKRSTCDHRCLFQDHF